MRVLCVPGVSVLFLSAALVSAGCSPGGDGEGASSRKAAAPQAAPGPAPGASSGGATPTAKATGASPLEFSLIGSSYVDSTDRLLGGVLEASLTSPTIGTPPTTLVANSAANSSQAVCSADFDNDGKSDLLFASSILHMIRWFKRTGPGPSDFDTANPHNVESSNPVSGEVRPAACGDVDGSNGVDVVVSFAGSGPSDPARLNLYVYLNNGSGSFTRQLVTTGLTGTSWPTGLVGKALANFTNHSDGRLDLVVAAPNGTGDQLQLFVNQGGGTPFTSAGRTSIIGSNVLNSGAVSLWGGVTAGDFRRGRQAGHLGRRRDVFDTHALLLQGPRNDGIHRRRSQPHLQRNQLRLLRHRSLRH